MKKILSVLLVILFIPISIIPFCLPALAYSAIAESIIVGVGTALGSKYAEEFLEDPINSSDKLTTYGFSQKVLDIYNDSTTHTHYTGSIDDYEELGNAYNSFTENLSYQGISSDGWMTLYPTYYGIYARFFGPLIGTPHGYQISIDDDKDNKKYQSLITYSSETNKSASFILDSYDDVYFIDSNVFHSVCTYNFSESGTAKIFSSCDVTYKLATSAAVIYDGTRSYSANNFKACNITDSNLSYIDDIEFQLRTTGDANPILNKAYYTAIHHSYCLFYPDSTFLSGYSSPESDYYYMSRPGYLIDNIGYYNENGDLEVIENQTIVNEGSNSYYSPVTGDTYEMGDFNYDYSTRTYNITYTDPDETSGSQEKTASISYNDDSITITDSGNTYNYYYVIENPENSQSSHVHSYSGTVTTPASCSHTGVKTYVCDVCGDTYTETIPALGHNWVEKTRVSTEYDDEGNLIQQGYVIYKCSLCGEEYRTDDTVNPSPPSGSSSGSDSSLSDDDINTWDKFITWLKNLFGSFASSFVSIVQRIGEIFAEIPDFFSDFTSFLRDAFSFLPSEVVTVLEFGVVAVVAIGIIKVFRGR